MEIKTIELIAERIRNYAKENNMTVNDVLIYVLEELRSKHEQSREKKNE